MSEPRRFSCFDCYINRLMRERISRRDPMSGLRIFSRRLISWLYVLNTFSKRQGEFFKASQVWYLMSNTCKNSKSNLMSGPRWLSTNPIVVFSLYQHFAYYKFISLNSGARKLLNLDIFFNISRDLITIQFLEIS